MGVRGSHTYQQYKAARGLAIALLVAAVIVPGCKLTTDKKASKGTSTRTNTSTTSSTNTSTSPTLKNILVSWTPNRESAVNTTGGGYKVYYSTTAGFIVPAGTLISVPYVSGATSPTSAQITGLSAGTYYVRVVAYSARNVAGALSAQATVVVP